MSVWKLGVICQQVWLVSWIQGDYPGAAQVGIKLQILVMGSGLFLNH